MKAQFTFHPERCVGCGACVMACVDQNQIDVDERKPYRLLKKNEYVEGEQIDIVYFTHGCMQCKDHPCANACRKGCFSFDRSTGTVILDSENCVGCHACERACPFDAIQFTRDRKAAKCNGCIQNLKRDRLPLCVMACPMQAITIDEKNDVLEAGRKSLQKELSEYHRRKGEA